MHHRLSSLVSHVEVIVFRVVSSSFVCVRVLFERVCFYVLFVCLYVIVVGLSDQCAESFGYLINFIALCWKDVRFCVMVIIS